MIVAQGQEASISIKYLSFRHPGLEVFLSSFSAARLSALRWALGEVNDAAIGAEVAAYLLPFFNVAETAVESGWRQYYLEKPDIYRGKDDAAFCVNRLLGHPLPDFYDVTPPVRDKEIEKLRKICADRGIQPAFEL